ncbi:MAG: Glu-tRNA(Gln) amidotransferase subunit GatD [Candidatus Pacearchaeota archaeon]|nr:Glu-tRNA(Gln) amidotransferase subunit GatD [Candidatus Pacearchaeota archaeon]
MESSAKPGDFVEVHFGKIIYEGVLLETPESEKGLILLKLGNGYNIGFNKKEILKIKVLKKFSEKKEEFEVKKDSSKPNIAMIITGGTISSRYDSKTGGVHPLDSPESLFKFYPELFEKVNVLKVEIPFMKFSEEMNFKDWQKIAKTCEKLLDDSNIQGVIVTHGTDFLHYTSAALSFMLGKLNKPVVLTYSQRSIDRASSDANLNLICSSFIAGISDIAEVVLVGHANSEDNFCYVMPGTKVRKMHTSRRDAFKVINGKPLAKVFPYGKLEIFEGFNKRDKGKKIKADTKFEEKVALVKIYPGQSPEILDYYLEKKFKGIVLELSGIGNASPAWIRKIKELSGKGIVFCGTSQCINGRVDGLVYSAGRKLIEAGMIYLEDMLAETALVKLGWVLGHTEWAKSREKIKEKMLEDIAGEFNKRLERDF